MRYLLDTNICIYLLKRQPPAVLARFATLRAGDAGLSVVTYAELRAGLERTGSERARNAQALAALIALLPVIPFECGDAETYGVLRSAVAERRRDALDRLIAAQAVHHALVLVTNNEADFAGYPGLCVENWVVTP